MKKYVKYILLGLFLWGGVGMGVDLLVLISLMLGFVFIFFQRNRIVKDDDLWIEMSRYGVFILLLVMTSLWGVDVEKSLSYVIYFASGLGLYVFGRVYSKYASKYLMKMIYLLAIVFGVIGLVILLYRPEYLLVTSRGLMGYLYGNFEHHQLGEFASVVILISAWKLWIRKKKLSVWQRVGVGLMTFFLIVSKSRAAVLGLLMGLGYLSISDGKISKKIKRKIMWVGIFGIGLFLVFGAKKPLLSNRQYFVQSIAGFVQRPLGYGVGNFAEVSYDKNNHWWGLDAPSAWPHSILFEMLSGMGVFSIFWIVWMWGRWQKMKNARKSNRIWTGVWILLLMQFLVSPNYMIPTLYWLWELAAGIAYGREK